MKVMNVAAAITLSIAACPGAISAAEQQFNPKAITSVLNAGVDGARISDAKELMAVLLPVLKARKIVLAIGINDAGTWARQSGVIEEDYDELVRLAKSSDAEVFVATVGPVGTTMAAGAAYDPSLIERINVPIKSVAARTGLKLIDLNTRLRTDETSDGVHPNEAGNRRWRDLIEAAVCCASPR
jgi:lysophospholipase L1-like esterase